MKIAMIGQKRIPAGEGGIEKSVEEMAAHLVERGHKVVVYNRGGHNIFGKKYDRRPGADRHAHGGWWRGIAVRTIRAPHGRAQVPVYSWRAMRAALKSDADVIILHGSGSCIRAGMAARRGRACVCMLHGIDSRRDKWGAFASRYLRRGERAAMTKADACIVLSRQMLRDMEEIYGRKAVIGINGVDAPAQESKAASESVLLNRLGLGERDYILWTGRIVPEKGLQYLIPAFRELPCAKKLVIAGGAEERYPAFARRIKEMAEGDPRIIFTGFIEPEHLGDLYRHAYACVFPSNLEGMSHSLLEALSYGNACLLSDIAENAEVAGEHAAYFTKGDQKDLKKKLRKLIDDSDYAQSLREGTAEYVTERYSWDKAVDILLETCRQAVSSHSKTAE